MGSFTLAEVLTMLAGVFSTIFLLLVIWNSYRAKKLAKRTGEMRKLRTDLRNTKK